MSAPRHLHPGTPPPRIPGATRVAAILWISMLQVFVVETIVIAGWRGRYSRSGQFISELGTGQCSALAGCVNLSWLMNASIAVAGLSLAVGAICWARSGALDAVLAALLVVGAAGLVGLAFLPLDSHVVLHSLAANIFFASTPVTLVIASARVVRQTRPSPAGIVALLFGLIASSSWVVHASGLAETNLDDARGLVQRFLVYSTLLSIVALACALYGAARQAQPRIASPPSVYSGQRWPTEQAPQRNDQERR